MDLKSSTVIRLGRTSVCRKECVVLQLPVTKYYCIEDLDIARRTVSKTVECALRER